MATFAGVIATRQGEIALVHERYDAWDRDYWNQPGGAVEDDESPIEAAVRELAEETGLVVEESRLFPISTMVLTNRSGEVISQAWNFTVEVEQEELAHADPSGSVRDARWFSRDDAVTSLAALPYPPIVEPAIAFLRGSVPVGTVWTFQLTTPPGVHPPQFTWRPMVTD